MVRNRFFRRQFPSSGCSRRFTVVRDDLYGAGLGFTAKLMTFALIVAERSGRILVEGESSRRWCTRRPGTLQCYYLPWTNCSLAHATDVRNLSLRHFQRGGSWYGMSRSTRMLQPDAFQLLFRPRKTIVYAVERVVAQCGGNDYWTVHVRDSPEKQRERGKLPSVERYLSGIPHGTKRVLWQTSNPIIFDKLMRYSHNSTFRYCHTNFSRHVHDVWGGRNASANDESGYTGAINGEAGRRGIGCISLGSSAWTWFITVGTSQRTILF